MGSYNLGVNYDSIFGTTGAAPPSVILEDPPVLVQSALYKEVEASFQKQRDALTRVESSINNGLMKLDWSQVDPMVKDWIYQAVQGMMQNSPPSTSVGFAVQDDKSTKNYTLPGTKITAWLSLPGEYDILVGLDHRDQLKGFGICARDNRISSSLVLSTCAYYDDRRPSQ